MERLRFKDFHNRITEIPSEINSSMTLEADDEEEMELNDREVVDAEDDAASNALVDADGSGARRQPPNDMNELD